MEIRLHAEDDEKEISLKITNNDFDNFNFVSLIFDDKVYDVAIEDLTRACLFFDQIRKEGNEKEKSV